MIFAFAGAMIGDPASINEGIQAAIEAGIKIAELIEELAVYYNLRICFSYHTKY
jgi:hypothetical protein